MESVQGGNLDVVVPMYTVDEIGIIARNFNLMTTKVKRLLHEVGLAKDKQKDAEIRALEAQINPHFLYNTLDSINWMAIEKEEYEISKMLRNLGVILRYSINKSNQMATIWEVSDVADNLEITPEYLSTLFNKEVGLNFTTFVKRFRISHAKRLLKGSELKIYQIASEVGYNDPKYFNRVFKEEVGISPGDYRQLQ